MPPLSRCSNSSVREKRIVVEQVSTLHANYFVNTGTGTASDALKLIEQVRKTVAKKTGVELELECKVIGV